jgi:hypothetical protein
MKGLPPYSEVQLIPLRIEGIVTKNQYYLLVIKNDLDCVDRLKSDFDLWEEGNDIRPDKTGQFSAFYNLIVDPGLIEPSGFDIFRLRNYDVCTIISQRLKDKLESTFIKGLKFSPVTSPDN